MTTKYTHDHEWINIEDHEAAVVGITHARAGRAGRRGLRRPARGRQQLQEGRGRRRRRVGQGRRRHLHAGRGEVIEVNEALRADPSLANSDPLGNGWFFKVHVTDMAEFDQLMDAPGLRRAAEDAVSRSPSASTRSPPDRSRTCRC